MTFQPISVFRQKISQLSKNLDEEIIVLQNSKPIGVFISYELWEDLKNKGFGDDDTDQSSQPRPIGLNPDKFEVPDSFFDPLPEDFMESFN